MSGSPRLRSNFFSKHRRTSKQISSAQRFGYLKNVERTLEAHSSVKYLNKIPLKIQFLKRFSFYLLFKTCSPLKSGFKRGLPGKIHISSFSLYKINLSTLSALLPCQGQWCWGNSSGSPLETGCPFWWEEVEKSGDVQTSFGVFLVDHEPHCHQCNLKNKQASINPGYDLHQTNEAFFSKFIYIYLYLYCMFLCWFDLCLFTLICI